MALASIVASLYCLARDFRLLQLVLSIPAVLLAAASCWILGQMLQGALPTFVVYYALVTAVLLVAVQWKLAR